jgi:amino acid adenylation domain-containing protein
MSQLLVTPRNHDIPAEWNRADVPYPAICIHELFEQQVERTPGKIAASFNEQNVTYFELNAKANQLANHLMNLGVRPETLVAVSLTRSLNMLLAVLAILKAGGAYVFLDPSYPVERLSFMLEDSQAMLLISEPQLFPELQTSSEKTLILDRDNHFLAAQSRSNPSPKAMPHNLAYVLYTSGSTGKPKGVQIEHRSVVNFLTSMGAILGFDSHDVLLAITTMSFDIAGLELYLPLVTGGRLIIASREMTMDGEQLRSTIEGKGVTVMQATPVTWQMLLDSGWANSSMKVLCGGEGLRRELARRLLRSSPYVWNLYGHTETTIWSTTYRVKSEEYAIVPIGKPIANTQMHILDSNLEPVRFGEIGELYIGGDGVARGYLKRPELTAQRFIADPFRAGARLHKTGDLARYLQSGDIEFLGRTDNQIKIRGFRIDLGEIESTLEERPDILHAVVSSDEVGADMRLTAYFVAKPNTNPRAAELKGWLRTKLPDYMVPAVFYRLDAMPLTFNGKIDRRALPKTVQEKFADEGSVAPRDRLETELVTIWEQTLGRTGIGVRDDFFDLGGYSVMAAKLMQRIEETWAKRLPIIALFRAPTIEKLAALLRKEMEIAGSSSQFLTPSDTDTDTLPPGLASLRNHTAKKPALRRGVNRILHLLSRVLPGASSVRPFLHRLRGVRIAHNVFIGDDVYIENEFPERVEIRHGATIGLRTTIVAHTGGAGQIIIGKNAFIGANSVLVTAGNRTLTIGEGAVLMAGSVVTADIPPFTVCGVERAKPLARLSKPFTGDTSYEEFITSMRPLGMALVAACLSMNSLTALLN